MLVKAAMNPTSYSLKVAIAEGQRMTWPKIAAIQANCAIEQTLDECMWELKKSVNNSLLKSRGRIPSWLNVDFSRENSMDSLQGSQNSEQLEDERARKGFVPDNLHIMQ